MNVAVVGATGYVGQKMIELLEKRDFPVTNLIPVASERSAGKTVSFKNNAYKIVTIEESLKMNPELALFSAGGSTSLEFAPSYAALGCKVIDNSSAWRMHDDIKLVVPEVNADVLSKEDMIIANPNCSTIQMVVALNNIHEAFDIKRLVISTYQSFTGTGMPAIDQYNREKSGAAYDASSAAYPRPIFENCLPHCDVFLDNDYTKEEMKLVHETRKILASPDIQVTATAVRVPVFGGHSESVNVEFGKEFDIEEVRNILQDTEGVTVMDNITSNIYPTPLEAHGKDDVFVGRIRRDESIKNGLNLWIVSDNIHKGAATNTIQIAEYLLKKNYL